VRGAPSNRCPYRDNPGSGPDGWKTEYVYYYTRPGIMGVEYSHWWYDHGRPIKKTKKYGGRTFDTTVSGSKK